MGSKHKNPKNPCADGAFHQTNVGKPRDLRGRFVNRPYGYERYPVYTAVGEGYFALRSGSSRHPPPTLNCPSPIKNKNPLNPCIFPPFVI